MRNRKELLQIISILIVVFVMGLLGIHSLAKVFNMDVAKEQSGVSSSSKASNEQKKPEKDIAAETPVPQSTSTGSKSSDVFSKFYDLDLSDVEEPRDLLNNEDFMQSMQQAGMSEEEIKAAIEEMQDVYEGAE